jgi:hypothetical protein
MCQLYLSFLSYPLFSPSLSYPPYQRQPAPSTTPSLLVLSLCGIRPRDRPYQTSLQPQCFPRPHCVTPNLLPFSPPHLLTTHCSFISMMNLIHMLHSSCSLSLFLSVLHNTLRALVNTIYHSEELMRSPSFFSVCLVYRVVVGWVGSGQTRSWVVWFGEQVGFVDPKGNILGKSRFARFLLIGEIIIR